MATGVIKQRRKQVASEVTDTARYEELIGESMSSVDKSRVESAISRMQATLPSFDKGTRDGFDTQDGSELWSQAPELLFDFDELDDLDDNTQGEDDVSQSSPALDSQALARARWANEPLFQLTVVSGFSGQLLCIVKNVSRAWRVDELKVQIQEKEGTPVRRQQLLFDGELAADQDILGEQLHGKAEVGLVRVEPAWYSLLEQVERGEVQLQDLDESARNERSIVLAAIRVSHGRALAYAGLKLRGDRQLVMEAVWRNGVVLRHASTEIRRDRAVVLAAIQEWPMALQYADDSLRYDRSIVRTAVLKNPRAAECLAEEFENNSEFALQLSIECPGVLPILPERYRQSRPFMLSVLSSNGHALKHTPQWQSDVEMVFIALHNSAQAIVYVGNNLMQDIDFVKLAVDVNPKTFQMLPKNWRSHGELALAAARRDPAMINFAHKDLRTWLTREIYKAAAVEAGVPEEYSEGPVWWVAGKMPAKQ